MSIDVLLASACIPQIFQAVEIDGECYWDGGYGGNPTLWPIVQGGVSRDVIVVQLAPEAAAEVPRDAASIRGRVNEIVFNSSLVAEMQAIAALRSLAARSSDRSPVLDLRLHRIGPPKRERYALGSAFERSRAWLEDLHDEGRSACRKFIARHGGDIGVRETLDIARVFTDARKPKMRVPPSEPAIATEELDVAEHAIEAKAATRFSSVPPGSPSARGVPSAPA